MHIAGRCRPLQFNRMEIAMTKSQDTAVTLTALTLAGTLAATSGTAQAHSHWGTGVGIGIAAGALIRRSRPFQRLCRPSVCDPWLSRLPLLVERYDRWGNVRALSGSATTELNGWDRRLPRPSSRRSRRPARSCPRPGGSAFSISDDRAHTPATCASGYLMPVPLGCQM